jgi:hypothetical protein
MELAALSAIGLEQFVTSQASPIVSSAAQTTRGEECRAGNNDDDAARTIGATAKQRRASVVIQETGFLLAVGVHFAQASITLLLHITHACDPTPTDDARAGSNP